MANIVLSEEECKTLEDDRVFISCPQRGKRKVSVLFLSNSPGSSFPSGNGSVSSTSSTVSFRYHRIKIQHDIEIPEKLESAAAFDFIGIMPDTAMEIYGRWESRPDPRQNPDDLLDYIYGHTSQLRKDSWNDYSDEQALSRLGVAQWLRTAILHPKYTEIYRTNTLQTSTNSMLSNQCPPANSGLFAFKSPRSLLNNSKWRSCGTLQTGRSMCGIAGKRTWYLA
jgi:hypothetical protein